MQTFTQTFASSQTWQINIPGKYFATIACSLTLNVRLYLGGKKLDLGDVQGLLAGLEIGPLGGLNDPIAFDRVEIDVQAGDTVTVAVGNGMARYNRSTTTITQNKTPVSSSFANTAKTVTNATAQLLAANTARQYLLIQNKDATGDIYVNFGAGAATTTNGVKIPAGGNYELVGVVSTQAVQAIGSIASNANVVVVEG